MKLKIRDELTQLEKNSYASAELVIPENCIDCGEGCNPYGYPKEILDTFKNFDTDKIFPYPHSMATTDAIIDYWKNECNLERENILLADGSISALYLINNIFNIKGAKVLGFAPQFADFSANIRLLGMDYKPFYANAENNFKMNIEDLIDTVDETYSLVYIDNPNNPTGQIFGCDMIKKLLDKCAELGVCVIIDEAYGDFMKKSNSSVQFLEDYENLIVVRTFSKGFGLAGLRAGYILASKMIISYMNKLSNPYQIGELTRELAASALKVGNNLDATMDEFSDAKSQIQKIIGNNLNMAETGMSVSICTLYHKDSNIDLQSEFLKYGVLTVPGAEFDGLDKSFVRVRMPKKSELPSLLDAIAKIDLA